MWEKTGEKSREFSCLGFLTFNFALKQRRHTSFFENGCYLSKEHDLCISLYMVRPMGHHRIQLKSVFLPQTHMGNTHWYFFHPSGCFLWSAMPRHFPDQYIMRWFKWVRSYHITKFFAILVMLTVTLLAHSKREQSGSWDLGRCIVQFLD